MKVGGSGNEDGGRPIGGGVSLLSSSVLRRRTMILCRREGV